MTGRPGPKLRHAPVHAAFAIVACAMVLAAAQPIVTDDLWLHLSLGRAHLAEGPWLAADPLLHNASGPPAPAAWLFDAAVFALGSLTGFDGLRALHVLLVVGLLGLVWGVFSSRSGRSTTASLGTLAFVGLCAYRLFQLRPQILTILAAIALYLLVIEARGRPSWPRIAASVGLIALWANVHGGFMLAPVMLGGALAALLAASPWQTAVDRARDLARAKSIAITLGLGLIASLATPDGWSRYVDFAAQGTASPDLAVVGDEWAGLHPFRMPVANLPPTPWTWLLFWILLVATAGVLVAAAREAAGARRRPDGERLVDPALAGMALLGCAGSIYAVRFLWLSFFPLLLLATVAGRRAWLREAPMPSARALVPAIAAAVLAVGFFTAGDWRMIHGFVRAALARPGGFAAPFNAEKYFAHAVWVLHDADVRGNAFNDYSMGGFLGFWLGPQMRGSANGTLNLRMDAFEANRALRERRGRSEGESFLELLDASDIDVFVGVHPAVARGTARPLYVTTTYLEGEPGWILAFRNVDSGVYVRADERNRENLARLARWYAAEGVPFSPETGFDVARVIGEAPGWAAAHGLVPYGFRTLRAAADGADPVARVEADRALASLYAVLGLYERAISIDERLLRREPAETLTRRRLVWSLLKSGRANDARGVAAALPDDLTPDPLTQQVLNTPEQLAGLSESEGRARVARLPLLWPHEAAQALRGIAPPPARPWPADVQRASAATHDSEGRAARRVDPHARDAPPSAPVTPTTRSAGSMSTPGFRMPAGSSVFFMPRSASRKSGADWRS